MFFGEYSIEVEEKDLVKIITRVKDYGYNFDNAFAEVLEELDEDFYEIPLIVEIKTDIEKEVMKRVGMAREVAKTVWVYY